MEFFKVGLREMGELTVSYEGQGIKEVVVTAAQCLHALTTTPMQFQLQKKPKMPEAPSSQLPTAQMRCPS